MSYTVVTDKSLLACSHVDLANVGKHLLLVKGEVTLLKIEITHRLDFSSILGGSHGMSFDASLSALRSEAFDASLCQCHPLSVQGYWRLP